jgi:hypothetical protein
MSKSRMLEHSLIAADALVSQHWPMTNRVAAFVWLFHFWMWRMILDVTVVPTEKERKGTFYHFSARSWGEGDRPVRCSPTSTAQTHCPISKVSDWKRSKSRLSIYSNGFLSRSGQKKLCCFNASFYLASAIIIVGHSCGCVSSGVRECFVALFHVCRHRRVLRSVCCEGVVSHSSRRSGGGIA